MKRILVLTLILLCRPARALPPEEKEMLAVLGKTVVQMIYGTQDTARAECEAGRAKLTEASPKYLGAYVESCLALAAAPFGPGKKPASCAYYQRALRIWKDNPPPKDDDDSRIARANRRQEWRKAVQEHCPEDAQAEPKAKPAPIPHVPGGIVETQEGISFELPEGWSVDKFDDISGWTNLKGPDGYFMRVERSGLGGYADYPDKENLPDGRELQTEYKPFLPKTKSFVLYARLMLKDECVRLGITRIKSEEGVEKDRGFAWLRAVASSVKVLGPRLCIGDCPPGRVKPKAKAAK